MRLHFIFASSLLLASGAVMAHGKATCDAGPKSGWQAPQALEKQLTDKGWKVSKVKEDGGCYEVYGRNEAGKRVEAYFHPVTLAPVPTK